MKFDRSKLNMQLAEKLMTTKDLCYKANIHPVTLSRALSGKQKPTPLTIGKIAKALGVPVETIVKEE